MIRTAESVTPNHPDKLCDQISDAILDEALRQDPLSRVAIEVMGSHNKKISVAGELTTHADVDIESIVKRIVGEDCKVDINIAMQSREIAQGVDVGGAGDQGSMVGYACDETLEYMPAEVILSRKLCQFIFEKYPYDGKTQVTLEDGDIKSVVASFQNVSTEKLKDIVMLWLDTKEIPSDKVEIYCNQAGDWSQGGFDADTGLTGRKIIVDQYGPRISIGGGAFSGKDATKVDRSAAYMARRIAVDTLRLRKAKEVFCYLAYVIGKAEPLQATLIVDGKEEPVPTAYPLTPNGIIEYLELKSTV